MYLEHFGLREQPFKLTPDTSFFYNYASHSEALNTLTLALRQGEGIVKLTGEVGSGKTLLCRMLLNSLEDEFVTAYIPNPMLSPQALHLALAEELRVSGSERISLHHQMKLITQRLIKLTSDGKRVAVLIDEAQAMPDETLEAVRLITNLETEKQKLLQVVLFGQNELDERLADPSLRQLRQRITFSHELQPLHREDVEGYINFRLNAAGYNGAPLFDPRACTLLHRASQGLPRLINVYAHKAMMAAYGRGDHTIERRHVEAAVADDHQGTPREGGAVTIPVWFGGLLFALAVGAVAMLLPEAREALTALLGGLAR
ncbi:ExeA family protein [Endothiovibrio diazotrophicus]